MRGRRVVVTDFGEPPPGYVPGRGRGAVGFAGGVSRDTSAAPAAAPPVAADSSDLSETVYDRFAGYTGQGVDSAAYLRAPDAEDLAADAAYAAVDAKLDERRRAQREQRLNSEVYKLCQEKPTVAQQLAAFTKGLAAVSAEEWQVIPDIGDPKARKKKNSKRLAPVPPSSFHRLRQLGEIAAGVGGDTTQMPLVGGAFQIAGSPSADGGGQKTPMIWAGISAPSAGVNDGKVGSSNRAASAGTSTEYRSLSDLGEAKGTLLTYKLDEIGDSVTGQTVIEPQRFLHDLNSRLVADESGSADAKRIRTLLKSVTASNPAQPAAWIAAARFEESVGERAAARNLIAQGCLHCPRNEDVWLEAARLEKNETAPVVLRNALKHISSVNLWLALAEREPDLQKKKTILRQSLESIPNSVRLWKEAIALETEPYSIRVLLKGAISQLPTNVDFRLELAKHSPYSDARLTLNEARQAIPASLEIWIAAAKLEESQAKAENSQISVEHAASINRIIRVGFAALAKRGIELDRDVCIGHADDAEIGGFPLTSGALASHAIQLGIQPIERLIVWPNDAQKAVERKRFGVARTIFRKALEEYPTEASLWQLYLRFEEAALAGNDPSCVMEAIQRAMTAMPNNEEIILQASAMLERREQSEEAVRLLQRTLQHMCTKELALAAVQLLTRRGDFDAAGALTRTALAALPTCEQLWIASLELLRRQPERTSALLRQIADAQARFPESVDLAVLAVTVQLELGKSDSLSRAITALQNLRKKKPKAAALWIAEANVLLQQESFLAARVVLQEARRSNPTNDELWALAVEVELKAGGASDVDLLGLDIHDALTREKSVRANSGASTAAFTAAATLLLNQGLRENIHSGRLWVLAIALAPKDTQATKLVDALNACEDNAMVVLAAARTFHRSQRRVKAVPWFERAAQLDPRSGDVWLHYLLFAIDGGDAALQRRIVERVQKEQLTAPSSAAVAWHRLTDKPDVRFKSNLEKLNLAATALRPDLQMHVQGLLSSEEERYLNGTGVRATVERTRSDVRAMSGDAT